MIKINHFYDQPQFGADWFTYRNLYSRFVSEFGDGAKFVEVGCWKGKSVAYLAVEIINSGKKISIDAIDLFEGDDVNVVNDWPLQVSPNHGTSYYGGNESLLNCFISNMQPLVGLINLNAHKRLSWDAASLYEDNSLDVVFIDACHEYDCVIKDVTAWLPKVKIGGYLSGHDYSFRADTRKAVDELLNPVEETDGCFVYRKTNI